MLLVGVAMIAVAGAFLWQFKSRLVLGQAGIKTTPRENSARVNIYMPTNVPGYTAEILTNITSLTEEMLPDDTSVQAVSYKQSGLPPVQATTVLMGTDRTSIHNPEFCLPGAGWNIDHSRSGLDNLRLSQPRSMDLPVMRMQTSQEVEIEGKRVTLSGVYVFWFVTDGAVAAERWRWMSLLAKTLLREGKLQRWAYVSYFTYCQPGQEQLAINRIRRAIEATAPEFVLVWPDEVVAP
jgi:hypothetical protein